MLDLFVEGLLRDSERLLTYKSLLLCDEDLANIGLTEERCDIIDNIEMAVENLRTASDSLRDAVAFLDSLDQPDVDDVVPL